MTEIALLRFAHVVAMAYWLGADLAVWYSSYFAVDRSLSASTRVVIIRILFALDLAPRICMTLMLPLGIHLAWRLGLLPVDGLAVTIVWAICLGWLSMVLYLHCAMPGTAKQRLIRFDFYFRVAVILCLAGYAAYSLAGMGGSRVPWVTYKLLIYALMVGCGLTVRIQLKPFGPAFGRLVQDAASDQDHAAISHSIQATKPFVLIIWFGLLTSAALGLHVI